MAALFGLDLGTTNSAMAVRFEGDDHVTAFLDNEVAHPSVVQYHDGQVTAGRAARERLEDRGSGVLGDIVRSPKHWLGRDSQFDIGGLRRSATEVVADLIRHVKDHAEDEMQDWAIDSVVATIPVRMDARGRQDLREAARLVELGIHQFVHEPLAALYGYIRSTTDHRRRMAELDGRLVLVFDWGGGTLDLTLCRVADGTLIQVMNDGSDELGGDRFDELLERLAIDRHHAAHGLPEDVPLLPGARAKLNVDCERAKIRLSRADRADLLVERYVDVEGEAGELYVSLTRDDLEEATADLVRRGLAMIDRLLARADVPAGSIELCLATGGMVQMPAVMAGLLERFGGPGRVPRIDEAGLAIARGAAWIATDQQSLVLAKPIELLVASDTYVPLFGREMVLPTAGQDRSTSQSLYCVDPRDGYARFLVGRPADPSRTSPTDPREPYGAIVVGVDAEAQPLLERLDLQVSVDENLVVNVEAASSLAGDKQVLEIQDLEFGLRLGEA